MTGNSKRFSGFTMVEVVLFLAISGAIVAALITGVSTPIKQQRYNDAVQDFVSFMQSEYSGASDIQNTNSAGNSYTKAIYGRMVTFTGTNASEVKSYTVVGNIDIDVSSFNNTLQVFKDSSMNLSVSCKEENINSYLTTWGAEITDEDGHKFVGSVLILRSPITGAMYTFMSNEAFGGECSAGAGDTDNTQVIPNVVSHMSEEEINFCIKMTDTGISGNKRRNVRIDKSVHSISSVRLVPLDTGENKCK